MLRVWRWVILAISLTAISTGLPVPDDAIDSSTKLLGSSVVTSVSVVMGHEDVTGSEKTSSQSLPPSPVDMLKPDGFQFYTVDEKGKLITRQMTEAEIQSIIAAGGGPFPLEAQDQEKTGENMTEAMKVNDVVQNVQNVLQSELNKPSTVMGTVPTIPGHASEEWSSILPSILGGDTETAPVTLPEADKKPTNDKEPGETPEAKPGKEDAEIAKPIEEGIKTDEKQPERPMIQVPVITADSVQPTTKTPSPENDDKPVYQILNTISVEEVKDENVESEKTVTEKESSDSPSPEIEVKEPVVAEESPTPTTETLETVIEMEVSSSFVPSTEEASDKPEATSAVKETEENFDTNEVKKPSIDLEAPAVADEKPVDPSVNTGEKEAQEDIPKDEEEKTSQQTEATTTSATIEQEVSETVNLIPESIDSIVEELISNDTIATSNPETQSPEVSNEKLEDSTMQSVSKKPYGGASDAEESPPVSHTTEPVFERLPDMSPESSATKPNENVANDSEMTVSGDKTTEIASEMPEDSTPVTELQEQTTNGDKKQETLLTELADSVSSMISQVSDVMPSMVPIPQKSEPGEQPLKRVEDGVKGEETSKPVISEAESPPREEEAKKPAESDPEVATEEVKIPDATTTDSIIETTNISDPVSESEVNDVKNAEDLPAVSEASSDKEPIEKIEPAANSEPEKIEGLQVTGEMKPEQAAEAPIVRIDITEAKPTVSEAETDDATESSVVRIKLTNTVSAVNELIDSAGDTVPVVPVQDILFPEKNVLEATSAENIGSSLIAGTEPVNITEMKTPSPTETANIDSDVKTAQGKPDESPSVETEAMESGGEKEPGKPTESENSNATSVPVDQMVKITSALTGDEKLDSGVKISDENKKPEEMVKPPADVPKPTEIPAVKDTPTSLPPDVVVSTTVEVQPTKESSDKVKDEVVEPPKSEEKPEDVNTKIEDKPEADDINVAPESTRPDQQATEVSTPAVDKKPEETAAPDSVDKNSELAVVENELPGTIESPVAPEAVKESTESGVHPDVVKTEDQKPESVGDEAEKKSPSVTKETPVPEAVEKDQTPVPLVRVDVTPEEVQSTNSTSNEEKISEAETVNGEKKTDEPKTPDVGSLQTDDETLKKGDSAMEISSEKETTASGLESSSKGPSKTEETELKSPAVKEPEVQVVKTSEESVKEAVISVDSKHPEVETTSPVIPTTVKIENEDNAQNGKPAKTQEVRIQVNDTAVLVTKHQIPQKVQPSETPDSTTSKTEEPADKIEAPIAVTNDSQESAKPPALKQDADEVKSDLHKKPSVDPYVKLGEKKQDENPLKPAIIPPLKKPSNIANVKTGEDKWTLIPQSESNPVTNQPEPSPTSGIKTEDISVPLEAHNSAVSLDESTRDQDVDISNFTALCNELAFSFWIATNKGLSTARSLSLSPFGMTSMLAMVFLGARGPTSDQMNDILKLDDVITFNPHLVFQNVSDSVNLARGQGIANAAFVRELFADRLKAGRLLPFYKERAQQFYDGHVEEVNFATISDLVRRRTNLLVRRQTGGRIRDFVKGNVMPLRSPLAALSANVFQTDCTGASSEGRDGEMYFAVLPSVRQRKLVPVPATVWKSGVLAGYEPGLDATVISLGGVGSLVSTIFVLPGQQGLAAPGDSLDHLEKRLLEGAFANGSWNRLIRVLIPRMGLEVQIPKFSHRSVVNATAALKRMGLDDLFSKHADLKGINGVGNDLHLADMLQINLFSTCGDEVITGGRHHVEIYPASPQRGARADKNSEMNTEEESDDLDDEDEEDRTRRSLKVVEYVQRSHDLVKRSTSLPSEKQLIKESNDDEERSERSSTSSKDLSQLSKGKQNERPLLKLDRPFLYFVRHNPTGMILHMGRFNPRLMP